MRVWSATATSRHLLQACRPFSNTIKHHVVVSPHCGKYSPYFCANSTYSSTSGTSHAQTPKLWQTDGVLRPVPTEELLKQTIRDLFPAEEMIFNARKMHNIRIPNALQPLEIDIYLPRLDLYFEYQDPHHFITVWYCHRTLKSINATDNFKKNIIESRGKTLIQVPCWWDGQRDSLAATIQAARPDLLQHLSPSSPPICDEIPDDLFRKSEVPSVGELMAPYFMNMKAINTNNWWLGEKYDGMRCCWNPETKILYSRSGLVLPLPDALKIQMPSEFLDGEIWGGRGSYAEVAKFNPIIKSSVVDWPSFRLVVFDVPNPYYIKSKTPFEERYERLLSVASPSHPFIIVANRSQLRSKDHLAKFAKDIMQDSGEGIILRQMQSSYENGRSKALGKIKLAQDTEALVTNVDINQVTLQLPDGTRFKAPTPAPNEISGPLPNMDDVVTFTFKRFSNGTIPVAPKIQRVRLDLTWDEVIAKSTSFDIKKYLGNKSRWSGNRDDMRALFEEYARRNNFDPLNSDNWYKVRRSDILATKGAEHMVQSHFNGSIVNALVALFPEIGLDKSKFEILPRQFWKETQHIRDYFINLANENGFDPFVAENWYHFPFRKAKKLSSIGHYYSYADALSKAFPEVLFEKKFQFQSHLSVSIGQPANEHGVYSTAQADNNHWTSSRDDMRSFFEGYARRNNFDPLNPDNWYKVRRNNILSTKGARPLLESNFDGSIANALLSLFPEIGLDILKFKILPRQFWKETEHIRDYFINLANENGFDPLVAENWYRFPFHKAKKRKSIERYYLFPAALVKAFPEVKFESPLFKYTRSIPT